MDLLFFIPHPPLYDLFGVRWGGNHSGKTSSGGVDLPDSLFLQLGQLPDSGTLDLESEKAAVNHAADGVAEPRGRAFPVGEFNIQLNANQSWDTAGISLSGLQQKNFLNADFVNAVESIDGVTGIKRWYYTDAGYRVNGNSGKWIQGFCRDEQQNLEKERIAGTIDYDELVAGRR